MMAVCWVIIWVLIVVGGCRGEKRWDIVVHILLGCRCLQSICLYSLPWIHVESRDLSR